MWERNNICKLKHILIKYNIFGIMLLKERCILVIHIFNRKELVVKGDMDGLAEGRRILAENNIDYTIKYPGNDFNNSRYLNEYKVYVHKENFEEADFLIRRK